LLVGGLLGREIFRILDKPNVVIQYRKITQFRQADGVYLSVRVGNIGRSAAERCMCVLSIFDFEPSHIIDPSLAEAHENLPEYKEENLDLDFPRYQIVQPESFHDIVSESLCWSSLGNPSVLDINPGTTQSMDICKFFKGQEQQYFIFPTEFGWRRIRVRVSAEQMIRGRLLVCPSNYYPTALDFELCVDNFGEPVFRRVSIGLIGRLRRFFSKNSLYTK
jgi:hypothetical protein